MLVNAASTREKNRYKCNCIYDRLDLQGYAICKLGTVASQSLALVCVRSSQPLLQVTRVLPGDALVAGKDKKTTFPKVHSIL
jgi:hypothetical protein